MIVEKAGGFKQDPLSGVKQDRQGHVVVRWKIIIP